MKLIRADEIKVHDEILYSGDSHSNWFLRGIPVQVVRVEKTYFAGQHKIEIEYRKPGNNISMVTCFPEEYIVCFTDDETTLSE